MRILKGTFPRRMAFSEILHHSGELHKLRGILLPKLYKSDEKWKSYGVRRANATRNNNNYRMCPVNFIKSTPLDLIQILVCVPAEILNTVPRHTFYISSIVHEIHRFEGPLPIRIWPEFFHMTTVGCPWNFFSARGPQSPNEIFWRNSGSPCM